MPNRGNIPFDMMLTWKHCLCVNSTHQMYLREYVIQNYLCDMWHTYNFEHTALKWLIVMKRMLRRTLFGYNLWSPVLLFVTIGVIQQYFLVSASTLWMFHVVSVFYKVMFPFAARKWKKKEKYFHLSSLAIGICMHYKQTQYMVAFYITFFSYIQFQPSWSPWCQW